MAKKEKFNIIAPLSVSIVVITLGAAFGVLSGRGAFIGMLSASIIATLTALIGGSRYGVSSPTGPMTAAIAVILAFDQRWLQSNQVAIDLDSLVNLTLVFSALILIGLTLIGVHKLIRKVPNLVVSGFVNGIALLIVIAQFNSISTVEDLVLMLITFLVAISISYYGRNFKHLATRILSSSISVIVLFSLLALFIDLPFSYLELGDNSSALAFTLPKLEMINHETLAIIMPLAFELALIALLDTLLTAVIMDGRSGKKTELGRELSGQSAALVGVSLIGGIPGAQSTVPSMMMLQEGGHHRYSKILLAVFCIIFTFLFAELIQYVPLAVFGGIILKIAFDVADFTSVKNLVRKKAQQKTLRLVITIGTTISTVLISLNLAVIGFTFLFICWNAFAPKNLQIADLSGPEAEGLQDEV